MRFEIDNELKVLGKRVRDTRIALDLSQEKLAERASLHRTYICDVERGARNLTIGSLLRLAKALGTTVAELTGQLEGQQTQNHIAPDSPADSLRSTLLKLSSLPQSNDRSANCERDTAI